MRYDTEFAELWTKLLLAEWKGKYFLNRIAISNVRGISDLEIGLRYPVTVLAGANGTGKSAALFAAACAYAEPKSPKRTLPRNADLPAGRSSMPLLESLQPPRGGQTSRPTAVPHSYRCNAPSVLFPSHDSTVAGFKDDRESGRIDYDHRRTRGGIVRTGWRCQNREWVKLIEGQPATDTWPQRSCYLCTLSDIANPAEARRVPSEHRGQGEFGQNKLSIAQVDFAESIRPHIRNRDLVRLADRREDLFFTVLERGTNSKLRMTVGERVALRFALEVARLHDALILVDGIDANLHPRTQRALMMGLQWLALRHRLQVIVTTHSPVVLECVPRIGRRFLERVDEHNGKWTGSQPAEVQ